MTRNNPIKLLTTSLLIFVLLFNALPRGEANASPLFSTTVVAYDMVGSTSQNLLSYSNIWEVGFTSLADGFKKYQRDVSASIPYDVLDDSLSIFPADSKGIIKEGNTDEFFKHSATAP